MEEWAIVQLEYFKAGLQDNLVVRAQKYTDGGDHCKGAYSKYS